MRDAVTAHSELKLVTCLFVDIVGSTDAVVRLGPERMQRLLSDGFAQISGVIKAHGGVVEKFVGDAILGTFGIPIARPDDAERALRAADACTEWAATWAAAGGLDIRAGIETGDLLVDSRALETQQRMMLGASINLAARLQSFAQPGEIIVGPGAHEATSSLGSFDSLGTVDLKGLGAVEAWRFDGFHDASASTEIEFVGRDAELANLGADLDRARTGSPGLALIVGPPGQGKSRLAREALARAEGFRVLVARCQPDAEAGANTPLRQLIEAEVGDATAVALHDRLVLLLGADEGRPLANAIAHGAGLLVDDRLLAMSRYEQRELIARSWERYLRAVTMTAPVALLVEDVHWGDAQLLRVIDYVASSAVGALLVIATARPEFVGTALRDGAGRTRIELGPLGADDAARLAGQFGAAADLSPESVERAGGNPLFLIELARSRTADGRLPMTIQAAIAARLDELDDTDRRLLQHASIVGERFTIRDAALLDDREPTEIVGSTARAAQLGFVVAEGAGFRFDHALVRDVVYGRLPVADRMALHARYATDGVDPADPEARAFHWWEALKPPDASWVWENAARLEPLRAEAYRVHRAAAVRAEQHNGYEQALQFNLRAIELADSLLDRAVAEAEAGRMYARQAKGDAGWAHRRAALDLYAQAGETPPAALYASMLELVGFNWGYFHDHPSDDEVRRLLVDGERTARATGDVSSLALLLAERASYLEDSSGADEIKQLLGGPHAISVADGAQRLATAFLWVRHVGDALSVFGDVFERLLPAGAYVFNAADARVWYGIAAVMGGDLELARRVTETLEGETEYRSAHTRSHYFAHRALVAMGVGDWSEVARAEQEMAELVERSGDSSWCLLSAGTIGFAAVGEVLHGQGLRPDIDAQVHRQVPTEEIIQAAALLLPKVMAGRPEALASGLRGYADGLPLADRYRVWDPNGLYPAIAMTQLERWDDVAAALAGLDAGARLGAKLAGAMAAAIREEQRAAEGGPTPAHTELRALGFNGFSELLRYRVPGSARAA
jgi:class 3 adenylate cyclase